MLRLQSCVEELMNNHPPCSQQFNGYSKPDPHQLSSGSVSFQSDLESNKMVGLGKTLSYFSLHLGFLSRTVCNSPSMCCWWATQSILALEWVCIVFYHSNWNTEAQEGKQLIYIWNNNPAAEDRKQCVFCSWILLILWSISHWSKPWARQLVFLWTPSLKAGTLSLMVWLQSFFFEQSLCGTFGQCILVWVLKKRP